MSHKDTPFLWIIIYMKKREGVEGQILAFPLFIKKNEDSERKNRGCIILSENRGVFFWEKVYYKMECVK